MTPDIPITSERGISLIEVLAALAILSLVLVAALQTPPQARQMLNRAAQMMNSQTDLAKVFLATLERPLCLNGNLETDLGLLSYRIDQDLGNYALYRLELTSNVPSVHNMTTHRILPKVCP